MKARSICSLVLTGLTLCARPLLANTVCYWNFLGASNGAAVATTAGIGAAAFKLSQSSSTQQPTGSTATLPTVTQTVNYLPVAAHFSAASSQYLAGPSFRPALNFPADSAFTVEAWVCLQSYPAAGVQRYIFSTRTSSAGNSGFALDVTNTGQVSFATDGGASGFTNLLSATVLALNQWYHVAGERTAGGASYLYINGVLDAQLASGNTYALSSDAAPQFGASPHWSQTNWDGYIAEVRISDQALAASQLLCALPTTLVYWNFNQFGDKSGVTRLTGTGATPFNLIPDSASHQPSASAGELPQWAYLQSPLAASGYFNNYSQKSPAPPCTNQYLVGSSVQSALNFGANTPFTVEAWVFLKLTPASGTQSYIFSTRTSSSGNAGFALEVSDSLKICFTTDGGASGFTNLVSNSTLALSTWYHIAGERTASGASYLYINGVLDSQLASGNTYALASDAAPQMGSSPHWYETKWDGYIGEVRISSTALAPAQLLYASGNAASWVVEASAGQSYSQAAFTTAESALMRVKFTALSGTFNRPALTALMYDFWGNSAGSVGVTGVSVSADTAEFDLTPAVPMVGGVPALGWYNLTFTMSDSDPTTGAPVTFNALRSRGDPQATETYNYLPFSIVSPPPDPAALPDTPFGVDTAVSTSQSDVPMPPQIPLIVDTGARWARDRFNWSNPPFNPDGSINWTKYKTNDDALAAQGLKVLQVVASTPNSVRTTGSTVDYPTDLLATYSWAASATASTTLASVKAWEIWNEMDNQTYSMQPPDLLAATIKAMALGFHSVANAPLVLSGPFGRDPTVDNYAGILGQNDISDYADGSSFHTYHAVVDPTFIDILDTNISVHESELGLSGLPLFMSETGLPYAGNAVPPVPAVAEANQVTYLLGAYVRALSQGIGPVCWFLVRPNFQGLSGQYGLTDSQLCPFPVYSAFAAMTHQLGLGEYHDCIAWDGDNSGSNDSTAWVFNNGTTEVSVLIGPGATDILTLPTNSGVAAVYDVMGAPVTVNTSGSALTVSSKGFPVYMVMSPGQHISSAPALTQPIPAAQNPSPIVLRVNYPADCIALNAGLMDSYDGEEAGFAPRGYMFDPGDTVSFTVDVYNFSTASATGSLSFTLPSGFSATFSPSSTVTVAAQGKQTVNVTINTSTASPAVTAMWTCNGSFGGSATITSSARWGPPPVITLPNSVCP